MKIITQLFKKKDKKKNEKLLKEYELGRVLQIDKDIDNKEFFKKNGS